jgi:peptide-methionine (R)-S-oxide reductase
MHRRTILRAGLLALPTLYAMQATGKEGAMTLEELHANWRDYLPADFEAPDPADKLALSKAEWEQRLSQPAFEVLRREGTERAFTSPLNDEKRRGVFLCNGCDLPLFTSDMKFDSGTGWPSFFTSIPGAFETKKDFKLVWPRTEYHCTRCAGHHGHVFNDGPPPTGERWCNNGVALKFLPA